MDGASTRVERPLRLSQMMTHLAGPRAAARSEIPLPAASGCPATAAAPQPPPGRWQQQPPHSHPQDGSSHPTATPGTMAAAAPQPPPGWQQPPHSHPMAHPLATPPSAGPGLKLCSIQKASDEPLLNARHILNLCCSFPDPHRPWGRSEPPPATAGRQQPPLCTERTASTKRPQLNHCQNTTSHGSSMG